MNTYSIECVVQIEEPDRPFLNADTLTDCLKYHIENLVREKGFILREATAERVEVKSDGD